MRNPNGFLFRQKSGYSNIHLKTAICSNSGFIPRYQEKEDLIFTKPDHVKKDTTGMEIAGFVRKDPIKVRYGLDSEDFFFFGARAGAIKAEEALFIALKNWQEAKQYWLFHENAIARSISRDRNILKLLIAEEKAVLNSAIRSFSRAFSSREAYLRFLGCFNNLNSGVTLWLMN